MIQSHQTIFHSPSDSPDPSIPVFRTTNGAFVAAVLAADLFEYLGAELLPDNGRQEVAFFLADPRGTAAEQQRRFIAGVARRVNPQMHNAARNFVKDEIHRIRGGRRGQSK